MKKNRIYSVKEAIRKTRYTLEQLDEQARLGVIKVHKVNGKKYFSIPGLEKH
jgi:hypothetical protein